MNAANTIIQKDPLLIADDDHPERKDIKPSVFVEALNNLQIKFGKKRAKDRGTSKTTFSSGVIDALNNDEITQQ